MSDEDCPCQFVIDCFGLHEIASTKSNSLKSLGYDLLSKGIIGVPSRVWEEFEKLYEDEAKALAPVVKARLRLEKRHHLGAATIADNLNSGFPLSPHDVKADFYAASICMTDGYQLITVASRVSVYAKMNCCVVIDIASMV